MLPTLRLLIQCSSIATALEPTNEEVEGLKIMLKFNESIKTALNSLKALENILYHFIHEK